MITRPDKYSYRIFIREGVQPITVYSMDSAERVLCDLWWMAR